MHLSQEIFSNKKLKLHAKKLLYSVNLDISCTLELEKFVISAKGPVRFGPYSKTLSLQTVYKNNQGWVWDSHSFCPEDRKFFFEAVLQEEVIVFKTATEKKEIPSPSEKWWDVLSLLLQLTQDIKDKIIKDRYEVLINKKIYTLESAKQESGYAFLRNGKKQFTIDSLSQSRWLFHISKMGLKLELSQEIC